jgi:hypothetical protein
VVLLILTSLGIPVNIEEIQCVALVITAKTSKATDESECNESKVNFVLIIALSLDFEQTLKKALSWSSKL